ncbi:MAG: CotH kinase family protein [Paludibacteraceae bacterium]|nr:CotH kinase family protein [Paludibacteraceae bacterium]
MRRFYIFLTFCALSCLPLFPSEKLTGTVIGSEWSVDYANTSSPSKTVNTRDMAFDGDLNTCFASWDRSYSWVGLDLGEPYIITKVGWSPRNDGVGPARVQLGVFEGAMREDFMDAIPLYIIPEQGVIGTIDYADINCTRGFRYVRYIGPADARCNIAEIEFYGEKGVGDNSHLPQLTNLPTVCIHTVGNQEPYDKVNQIESYVSIVSGDGRQLLQDTAFTRLRGNASMDFPKKPYRIKFAHKHNVLNSPAKAKKWTLINNYGDKTLMRNQLAFELSRRLGMPYTPFCAYADVVLNGEYKGCYQLCDQIQVHKQRVNIDEMTPRDNSGEALTGGYLIEADAYAYLETSMFWSQKGTGVTIKSPDEDSITYEQKEYIRVAYDRMEGNWRTYLDMNTFLRHFLVGEMSGNTDTYWSVYFYKRRGNDTIFTGPVWDFDLAFDNDTRIYPVNNKSDFIYRSGGSTTGYMRQLADNVAVNSKEGREMLLNIWAEAREKGLTEENFLQYIDEQARMLEQSQRLNFIRWPIMNQYVHQNARVWGSYAAEVNNVKNFISKRIPWMDKRLGYTYVPPVDAVEYTSAAAFDKSEPYMVYTIAGQYAGSNLSMLSPGMYILRQGSATFKILVQ